MKHNEIASNTDRTGTIVVKLLRYKSKTKIFNKLKGQNVCTTNIFSKATLKLRKDLRVAVERLK